MSLCASWSASVPIHHDLIPSDSLLALLVPKVPRFPCALCRAVLHLRWNRQPGAWQHPTWATWHSEFSARSFEELPPKKQVQICTIYWGFMFGRSSKVSEMNSCCRGIWIKWRRDWLILEGDNTVRSLLMQVSSIIYLRLTLIPSYTLCQSNIVLLLPVFSYLAGFYGQCF